MRSHDPQFSLNIQNLEEKLKQETFYCLYLFHLYNKPTEGNALLAKLYAPEDFKFLLASLEDIQNRLKNNYDKTFTDYQNDFVHNGDFRRIKLKLRAETLQEYINDVTKEAKNNRSLFNKIVDVLPYIGFFALVLPIFIIPTILSFSTLNSILFVVGCNILLLMAYGALQAIGEVSYSSPLEKQLEGIKKTSSELSKDQITFFKDERVHENMTRDLERQGQTPKEFPTIKV